MEALPLDGNGNPILDNLSAVPGKITVIDEDGKREIDGLRVQAKMEEKEIHIRSANVGKVIDVFPGSKLTLYIKDAINGQICPPTLCLGETVLVKDKVYELEYDTIPINGWTIRDRSDVKNPNAKQLCYPEGIRNQKELMDLILGHESTFTCSFVRMQLTHPPEIQRDMDLAALDQREAALLERRAAIEAKLAQQEKELKKERDKFLNTKKGA
jgi:hypothetical protein